MSTDTPASLPAELSKKHEALKEHLTKLGAVAVAFSGGVDSTLLLSVAADVLGDNTVAITARAQMIPAREVREASDFCAKRGIRHVVMDVDALTIPGFAETPQIDAISAKAHYSLASWIKPRAWEYPTWPKEPTPAI